MSGPDPVLRKYHMYLNKSVYEELGEGLVKVTAKDGRTGIFRYDGPWVEGDLREANLNMLLFTGGPNLPDAFTYRWTMVPAATDRPSGWPKPQEDILREREIL